MQYLFDEAVLPCTYRMKLFSMDVTLVVCIFSLAFGAIRSGQMLWIQGDAQGAPQDAQPQGDANGGDNVQDVDYEEVK